MTIPTREHARASLEDLLSGDLPLRARRNASDAQLIELARAYLPAHIAEQHAAALLTPPRAPELTDDQAADLLRALAAYAAAYSDDLEPGQTVAELARDLIDSLPYGHGGIDGAGPDSPRSVIERTWPTRR